MAAIKRSAARRRGLGQEFLVGEVFPLVRTMMKPKEWLGNETFIIH